MSQTLPPKLERFWRTDDGMTAVERAEAYGIDVTRFENNLRLTPVQRLEQNDRVLDEAEKLASEFVNECGRRSIEPPEVLQLVIDALITAKRAMGRPRDLHAVLELEAIREKLHGPR